MPSFQSRAHGVGPFGEHEQAIPSTVSPKATGSESEGHDDVTKALQFGAESPPRPGSIGTDGGRVFAHHNARAKCLNNADELMAERRRECALMDAPGSAVVLTGIAAANDVNSLEIGSNGSDILVTPHMWPVFLQNGSTERVNLYLPSAFKTGALESKIESSDAGEETAEREAHVSCLYAG